ncbi:Hypothetical predicted protein [Marmota monax]|uniref:Uncharacterized protein n=1 Tax=Marmota monax TaxID=9995 RepID=A0A5E4C6E2_MARMO|nr:hypothetical protein GHT09_008033 [Marmota monax]VTJ77457.1 Hypothetical predicted protein [Marmota monax]
MKLQTVKRKCDKEISLGKNYESDEGLTNVRLPRSPLTIGVGAPPAPWTDPATRGRASELFIDISLHH